METHGPEWREFWCSNNLLVSLNDLLGATLHHEVSLNLTTKGNESEGGSSIIIELDDRRHSIGASEVDTQELISFVGLHEDKWVNTVSLSHTLLSIIMRGFLTVSPHGPNTLGKLESSVSLTKTIDLLGAQLEVNLEVLVHQEGSLIHGRDKHLAALGRSNLKVKWIAVKLEVRH